MRKTAKSLTPTFIYILISIAVFLFGLYPQLVEKYYSQLSYPLIGAALRCISSFFPFAVGDLLYTGLVVYLIIKVFIFIRKPKNHRDDYLFFCLKGINFFLLIYISFKLLWGLNYSRPPINQQLQINNKPYQKNELLALSNLFINKLSALEQANMAGHNYRNTTGYLENKAVAAYNKLAESQSFFRYKYTSVKSVASPWLVSKLGIEGYYNPWSGEASINTKIPAFVLPFVTCHEIAHQLGVAKEDEANLVGYLTAIHSGDERFLYSAYYNMLRYILFEIRMKYPEDYNIVITKIPTVVMNDFKTEREFWAKYNGQMSIYMGKTFDKILKLNNQVKGVDSYQDIVLWLYNYHKGELIP